MIELITLFSFLVILWLIFYTILPEVVDFRRLAILKKA